MQDSERRIATTRAATRAFSSSVSPGTATKVPVDWSLAIFAARLLRISGRLNQIGQADHRCGAGLRMNWFTEYIN